MSKRKSFQKILIRVRLSTNIDWLPQLSRQSARLLTERSLVRTQPGASFYLFFLPLTYTRNLNYFSTLLLSSILLSTSPHLNSSLPTQDLLLKHSVLSLLKGELLSMMSHVPLNYNSSPLTKVYAYMEQSRHEQLDYSSYFYSSSARDMRELHDTLLTNTSFLLLHEFNI